MHWLKLTSLTISMAVLGLAAPQSQQISAPTQTAAGSAPVGAQSRDNPVYSDPYSTASFGTSNGVSSYSSVPAGSYVQPQAAYGTQQQTAASSNYGTPANNQGYFYYYYPVQESKADYHAAPSDNYPVSDSYGIDPIGIIAVLAVAGLVIAGLALLFPGWAFVRSDESVYYRSNEGSSSFMGLNKDDFLTLTRLVVSAIEGERCMDRTICNAGKLVKKVKKADSYLRMMQDYAPTGVAEKIKKLRRAMAKGEECKNVKCSTKQKN